MVVFMMMKKLKKKEEEEEDYGKIWFNSFESALYKGLD